MQPDREKDSVLLGPDFGVSMRYWNVWWLAPARPPAGIAGIGSRQQRIAQMRKRTWASALTRARTGRIWFAVVQVLVPLFLDAGNGTPLQLQRARGSESIPESETHVSPRSGARWG